MVFTNNTNITNWTGDTPSNLNHLQPNNFVFTMNRIRNVSFACQTANIPSLQLGQSRQFTRLKDLNIPGDKVEFGSLDITFLVDENMENFRKLYDWIKDIGTAQNSADYDAYINRHKDRFPGTNTAKNLPIAPTMSDAIMTITDSNNVSNLEIRVKDLFPTSLEGLRFDTTDTSLQYLTAAASFQYNIYEIVKL